MIKKLPPLSLLMTTILLFSCNKNNSDFQGSESQTAIEMTSIVTFLIMTVALLIAYRSKRRP